METKKRLGELLLEAGVIDETQLQSALGHQRRWGMKLGQALLDLKLATEPQVVAALAKKFGYEVANLGAVQPGPVLETAMRLVPKDVAAKHTLLPVAADTNSITVAMADPTNIAVVDELSFRTGRRVKVSIAGERELATTIRRLYFGEEERRGPEPIALDDADDETVITTDPYSALPEHLREGYVGPSTPPPVAPPGAAPAATPAVAYRARTTPPPVLRPVSPTPAQAFRPAPAPPVAAPPLPQPAAYRPPPPAAAPSPLPAYPAGPFAPPAPFPPQATFPGSAYPAPPPADPIPDAEVVDMSDLAATPAQPALTPREAALADALDRLSRTSPSPGGAAVRVAASMVRLLIKKGYFSEVEFLDELQGGQ